MKAFKYTSYAISVFQKIVGSNFTVSGLENVPKGQSLMFVANHFTRSETFFVPYLIDKYLGLQVRSLADSSLFQGFFGRFLQNVGCVSTKNPKRNKIIVSDLVKNEHNWLIYPEGGMVKSKKIVEKGQSYITHMPYRVGSMRTGAAVLALKSILYRGDIVEAYDQGNQMFLDEMRQNYGLSYDESLRDLKGYVVPISITYYPIRPGENKFELFAKKKFDELSPRLLEELQIEGNLLSKAKINLHFGKAIDLSSYVNVTKKAIYNIPIIKNYTKTNFVIKYYRHRLTNEFMRRVYSNVEANIDHIFSAVLRYFDDEIIEIGHLKRIIYLSAMMMIKSNKCQVSQLLNERNIFKLFIDEPYHEFDDIFNLALRLGEITKIDAKNVKINKKSLQKDDDFHEIRLNDTLQVIFNEFSLLGAPCDIVRRNCFLSDDVLRKKVVKYLLEGDKKIYEQDYKKYFDKNFSKKKGVGAPYLLNGGLSNRAKVGVLLCHGYKSSPKEVELLAKYIKKLGFTVYVVRLEGHGTAPVNIADVSWRNWYYSLQRGYAILRNVCDEMVVVGFSTGGLLALLSDARKDFDLKGVVSINAALRLRDVRAKFVPAINRFNDILRKFHIDANFNYIDDKPENPEFNYSRNYLHGVEELGKLMEKCEENIKKVTAPLLVIQATNDPVVSKISGDLIYRNASSQKKEIYRPHFSNHVIINGRGADVVFKRIEEFLIDL